MFKPVLRILLKLFELCGCVACVITKVLTDQEARRVAIRNQKYSMEWALLTNVTWSREGSAFANITYGGYTLITSLLLISRIINAKSRPSSTEKVFLTVGMLFFIAMGGLVFASLEQVPQELYDNAIILGSLSFLVALLFLIDLADPIARYVSKQVQTEHINQIQNSTQTQIHNQNHREFKELNIPNLHADITPLPSPDIETIPPNGHYFAAEQVDIVHAKTVPKVQHPVFAKILTPEKTRPFKRMVPEPHRLITAVDEGGVCAQGLTYTINRSFQSDRMRNEYPSDEDNLDKPMRQGFVANAARMWERRMRRLRDRPGEMSTIV